MWNWLKDKRREKILAIGFPATWEKPLETAVSGYPHMSETQRQELKELTQIFIAEKHWEGCGGLILTDEMRVTIAAQACLMILELPHNVYRNVESIFIYPTTVITPERPVGFFETPNTPVHSSMPILGEAHVRGPVILVWDSVLHSTKHPQTGHNVVYHEFAHKLDMLDGNADGTPPLEDKEQYRQWINTFQKEFLNLRNSASKGQPTFLDTYGATNEAEFFAVVTEEFFDRPKQLQAHHKNLYQALSSFYKQNPAQHN